MQRMRRKLLQCCQCKYCLRQLQSADSNYKCSVNILRGIATQFQTWLNRQYLCILILLDSKLSRIGFLFMETNTELLGYHHRPAHWACRAVYTDGSGMSAKTSASLRFNPIKVTRTAQCSRLRSRKRERYLLHEGPRSVVVCFSRRVRDMQRQRWRTGRGLCGFCRVSAACVYMTRGGFIIRCMLRNISCILEEKLVWNGSLTIDGARQIHD